MNTNNAFNIKQTVLDQSVIGDTSMLLNVIKSLELCDLDLKWKKNKLEVQTYNLEDSWSGIKADKVWKNGADWCGLSGSSYKRLSDAKAAAEKRVKENILNDLIGINMLMVDESMLGIKHKISSLTKSALEVVLAKLITRYMNKCIEGNKDLRIRDKNNRFGNALVAFDYKGDMASILKFGIKCSWLKEGSYLIGLDEIGFECSINKNIAGEVLDRDRSFGEKGFGSSFTKSLGDDDLEKAMRCLKDGLFNYMKIENEHVVSLI